MAEAVNDPFKPPKANLEVPVDRGPMPRAVKSAFLLLCTSAGLTLLLMVATLIGLVPVPGGTGSGAELAQSAASSLVGAGIIALLAAKIRNGRNWARWVLAVMTVLGIAGWVMSVLVLRNAWNAVPLALLVVGMIQTALQLVAVVLAFTPQSRAWFRSS